jgi:tetratricopeptide (TPR) repeat protein/predicted Ser/Thr protein kinase
MNCPRCGTENPAGAPKCSRCGISLAIGTDAETFAGIVAAPIAVAGSAPARAPEPVSPSMADMVTAGPWAVASTPGAGGEIDFGPRYKIQKLLGEGGMGAVYKAYDTELDRTVALKLIRPGLAMDANVSQRFKQELLLASKISHKNILRIHDLGDANGVKFISMAYVEGQDLHQLLTAQGKLPIERALNLTKQLCAALDAAHSEGVVHRDFKPQNILLDKNEQAYITDFGLAKSLEADAGLSRSGEFLGTPRYMAPEQVEGRGIDHRVDIYALGLIMYEMLTGDVPFHADSTIQLMYKRVNETPNNPKTLNPDLPDWLARVVMKCLERDPDKRYQNASDVLSDVQNSLAPVGSKSGSTSIAFTVRRVELEMPAAKMGVWIAIAIVVIAAAITFGVPSFRHKVLGGESHVAASKPISVLVADFENHTGDPVFDGTLEPMMNVALEGAKFINAYNRGSARKMAESLPHGSSKLDEQSARLVALSQGIPAIITGDISRRGDHYELTAIAIDAATGNELAKADVRADNKDDVLSVVPKLAAPIRQALGDNTPESVQLEKEAGAFTSSNLEAVHDYAVGMDEQFAGDFQHAYKSFENAVKLDPNFARAYAGMAGLSWTTGKMSDAEKNMNAAMQHVDRMTDRERYRMRAAYFMMTNNWQKCVEEFTTLVTNYPADNIAYPNLAGCYMGMRNAPKAVEAARKAVELSPKGVAQRYYLSFYSSYGGDFQTGEQAARAGLQINPASEMANLALAESQIGQGHPDQADATYATLGKISPLGASIADAGRADLAAYEGRYSDAIAILQKGAAADLAAKNPENAAEKLATVARLELLGGRKSEALAAADKAIATNAGGKIRFLVAETLLDAGEGAKAQKLVSGFASALQAEPQAYSKIVEGRADILRGAMPEGIKALTEANKTLNTWIGHFELGRAYLQAGAFVEAGAEFDECIRRRGEALEILMDNYPTYEYFPLVYYYQGRVREGLKSSGSVDSYRQYLAIRGQSNEDPLVADARRRIAQSGQ